MEILFLFPLNLWTCTRKIDKVVMFVQVLTKIVHQPNLNILIEHAMFKFEDSFFNVWIIMIIRIIYDILYMKALFMYIVLLHSLIHFSKLWLEIIKCLVILPSIMVSKVILITHIYAQLSMVVTILGNPIL